MKKKLGLSFLFFYLLIQNVFAINDCRLVKNQSIIDLVRGSCKNISLNYKSIIFIANMNKTDEVIVSAPVFESDNNCKFVKKMIALITIKKTIKENIEESVNYNEVFTIMNSENSSLNFKYEISNLQFSESSNYNTYVSLLFVKHYLRLGNCIDPKKLEEDGRVYYTVLSEDKLDDIHMVYESGNEKKEFKFTNSPEMPIVPVEEANKINQENIKPKKNFFSLPNFISKFFKKNYQEKNNNDFLDEEQKKLKVD